MKSRYWRITISGDLTDNAQIDKKQGAHLRSRLYWGISDASWARLARLANSGIVLRRKPYFTFGSGPQDTSILNR